MCEFMCTNCIWNSIKQGNRKDEGRQWTIKGRNAMTKKLCIMPDTLKLMDMNEMTLLPRWWICVHTTSERSKNLLLTYAGYIFSRVYSFCSLVCRNFFLWMSIEIELKKGNKTESESKSTFIPF